MDKLLNTIVAFNETTEECKTFDENSITKEDIENLNKDGYRVLSVPIIDIYMKKYDGSVEL